MSEQKKKSGNQGKQAKPWEKMNAGKKQAKPDEMQKGKKKSVPCDFLYLLPKRISAKELGGVLHFVDRDSLEIWNEECVVEITTQNGTITFEDIRDSLEKEDEKVLSALRMKQVLSCDYESSDAETVRRIMEAFLEHFGGRIGTDTEDFTPFLTLEDL